MIASTAAPSAPSLELNRSAHRIQPVPHQEGWQVCAHCGVRVYQLTSLSQRWQHDMNVVRRLVRDETNTTVHELAVPYVSEIQDDGLGQAKARDDLLAGVAHFDWHGHDITVDVE